jgi:thiol-disulfide isomerase/thioredoxin
MYNPLLLTWFLLILCCNFSCNPGKPGSSVARIEVSGGNIIRKNLAVSRTVHGNNFWANKKTFSLDNKGESIININKEDCGLVLLKFDDGFVSRMIVAPGDQVKVNVIANPQGRPRVVYEGDNAAGHQFFNALDRPFILDINNPYQQDSNVADIKHKIRLKMEQELSALKDLLDKEKINKAYETLAALDIRYYYAASLADALCSKYYLSRMDTNNQHAVAVFREKYGKAWEQAFSTMPLHSNKALTSEYFRDYARLYYEYYLGQYAQDKSGLLPSDTAGMQDLRKQEWKHILNYSIIDRNFKDSIAEYLKAVYLYYAMSQRTYEQSLLTLYTKFRQQYPDSRYRPFFKKEADKILVYQKTKDKNFTPEQQFLSGYERINSLSELRSALKNGPYYVDIWATWCGPCKAEFKFNASLSALLREYNVKPLYLSIDKDIDDEDWKNMIKYYKLPGIHLRANDNLRKDIANKLGKNKRFSIPRYVIIDKNGGIVNSDAERPSGLDDLRAQISKLD